MKRSPVTQLRTQKQNLEQNLALALANGDLAEARRLRQSIQQVDAYLRSWGALVR